MFTLQGQGMPMALPNSCKADVRDASSLSPTITEQLSTKASRRLVDRVQVPMLRPWTASNSPFICLNTVVKHLPLLALDVLDAPGNLALRIGFAQSLAIL